MGIRKETFGGMNRMEEMAALVARFMDKAGRWGNECFYFPFRAVSRRGETALAWPSNPS